MEKIKVTCDSTCDLTPELYERYGVEVVPLGITLGEDSYYDGVNVTVEELFAFADRTGTLPKTSAISPSGYAGVFRPWVEQGYTVIHINISSEFSACYQNACLAAAELGNVYPIDSRNLSSGSGHLVLLAAELAAQGKGAGAIVDILNERKEKLDVSFVLQHLDYLRMGGRCSGVAVLGANLLKLRPEIRVTDGKMGVGTKYRGSMERSVLDYIRGRLANRDDVDPGRIFVTHSPMPEELVDKAVALVKELHPFREVIVTCAGSTISSHCGPECLGVLFFRK
ncbi:MAG: DegV family protein [Ruminococcaceae bacterium]|jgi:DegV family protein with EDD domain|nr:DegV family protein [Oscillospiraceae bacterium]